MAVSHAYAVPHPPLIIPEVGGGEEKTIQPTVDAYNEIAQEIAGVAPDTIVVVSPHAQAFRDYIHIESKPHITGDLLRFGARTAEVHADTDTAFVNALSALAAETDFPAGSLGGGDKELDHGSFIPIHFVNKYYTQYKLVIAGISGLAPALHYRFGMLAERAAEQLGRKTVFIASGDLSHKLKPDGPYGYAKEGPLFDKRVVSAFESADFRALLDMDGTFCENAAECGLRAFISMAGALDGKAVASRVLSYEGPFGVGYATAAFRVTGEDPSRRFLDGGQKTAGQDDDPYVQLARTSLETYLETGRRMKKPNDLPKEMDRSAGIFVSLKKNGSLRGCIGTIEPSGKSIADEVINYAIISATEDPRFPPVDASELPELVYSIDILGDPEPVSSVDDLDAKEYGVIVSNGYRRGVLLPNLEGVDTPEDQIGIALSKAGISPNENYDIQRFKVVCHK